MKAVRIIIVFSLFVIFAVQASLVMAKNGNANNPVTGPVTNPITSPITSPLCKPGWGFGDKNHCHFGPPGQISKDLNKFFSNIFGNVESEFNSLFHF